MEFHTVYECQNDCATFRTIAIPTFCPFCGTRDVYQVDESVTIYQTMDEHYENTSQ